MTSSCALRTFRHTPLLAVLLAVSFGAHAQATAYKMRIPVGPIAAAAPAPDISIPGYNPVTDTFQSAQGSFTWNGTTYGVTTGTAFGHTGPVTLTPAVTADAVKAAIRDNPGSLAGTLAEGWITGEDMTPDGVGGWTYNGVIRTITWNSYGCPRPSTPDALLACLFASQNFYVWSLEFLEHGSGRILRDGAGWYTFSYSETPDNRTATQGDWDALPDPLPTVAPELPYAPYLPGVAVQNNFQILDLNTNTTHNCTNGGCD